MPPGHIRGIRRRFRRLSPWKGQVPYVLLTRAPVAGGSASTSPLPLDLHVLSLSLAFILSQDQTLRCCYLFRFPFFKFVLAVTHPSDVDGRSTDASIHRVWTPLLSEEGPELTENLSRFPCLTCLVADFSVCRSLSMSSRSTVKPWGLSRFASAKLRPFSEPTKYFRDYFMNFFTIR